MRERIWQAVADVRWRLARGWMAWETIEGTVWAKFKNAHTVLREPMTEDEESVVDYVLKDRKEDQ